MEEEWGVLKGGRKVERDRSGGKSRLLEDLGGMFCLLPFSFLVFSFLPSPEQSPSAVACHCYSRVSRTSRERRPRGGTRLLFVVVFFWKREKEKVSNGGIFFRATPRPFPVLVPPPRDRKTHQTWVELDDASPERWREEDLRAGKGGEGAKRKKRNGSLFFFVAF